MFVFGEAVAEMKWRKLQDLLGLHNGDNVYAKIVKNFK
jgi:hypothetical protein